MAQQWHWLLIEFILVSRYELKGQVYARSNIIHLFLSQQLSQFWYSPETALRLAEDAVAAAGEGGR